MSEKRLFVRFATEKEKGNDMKFKELSWEFVRRWWPGTSCWPRAASAAGLWIAMEVSGEGWKSGARCPGAYQQWRRR